MRDAYARRERRAPQHLRAAKVIHAGYNRSASDRSPEIFGRRNSMAAAEAWDAALLMAPTSVLASVAAWR